MCTEKYIYPITDFGFKLLFGTADNKEFLMSFLNSLLWRDDEIVDITYKNTEMFGISERINISWNTQFVPEN